MRSFCLVTPHLRGTTGGVYSLTAYARELARTDTCTVAVGKGDLEPVGQATVTTLDRTPMHDVSVLPADMPNARAVGESVGKHAVIYLQGFGSLENPTVLANLGSGLPVIASSSWLADRAVAAGASARFVPYGLDRSVFYPGERSRGAPIVTMMTHHIDWKGLEDGIAALRSVQRLHDRARIQLFGVEDPAEPGMDYQGSLPRSKVGALLRRSTVFVCSSWQEGFGMPGLEALASGAALATTDTLGSRDYAHHRRSALVSPPRDPAALAANIGLLLSRTRLRRRVVRGGLGVATSYPDWTGSSERFRSALLELTSDR